MAQSAFKPGSQTAGGFSEGPMLGVALGLDFFSRGVGEASAAASPARTQGHIEL